MLVDTNFIIFIFIFIFIFLLRIVLTYLCFDFFLISSIV